MERGLEFADVLVRPIPSNVNSRTDVDISVRLSDDYALKFPLIAAPMRGIIDASFAKLISDLGGLAILHRFYDTKEELENEITFLYHQKADFGVSVGLHDNEYVRWLEFQPRVLCVDIANGYTESLLNFCAEIKSFIVRNNLKTLLMSGNVCTRVGAENLRDAGVDVVRYGIGSGGLCSTRTVTGIGVPQVTALQEAYDICDVIICSDGGITSSGDFVKAIVAGADLAMAGSLFATTYESPSNGTIYGMASRKLNEMMYTQIKSIEGIEQAIKKTQSLESFMDAFSWGIRSAGTYLGATSLEEIRAYAEFELVGSGSIKNI